MFIPEFIEYLLLEKNSSNHTATAYKADIMTFVAFYKKKYNSSNISASSYVQIRSWIIDLVDQNITNRTINRKIASLKAYYKFLLKIEHIDNNPLIKHRALKTSKKLQIPFSIKEVDQVLTLLSHENDFKSIRDRLIVELFYATGIRRTELVNLKRDDIDIMQSQIKVLGKRNKERLIPLIPSVTATLHRYIEVRNEDHNSSQSPYLLITEKGVKIYETLVYRIVNSYFSKASAKTKTSPHILRHTFATHMLGEGANINAVKELLGHSSLAATQIYTHQSIAQLGKIHKETHPRNKK